MSRSRYVTPSRTAERIERVRKLITALQVSELSRDEIGGLLSLSAPAVRKYMVDLSGILESSGEHGHLICRLTSDKAKVANYLANLDAQAPARPIKPRACALTTAAKDPARHFHIMDDDVEFPVRVPRGIPAHEPLMAHFYKFTRQEARA
jgi:hypothetical protein